MTTSTANRVPTGVPAGGEFTSHNRGEADTILAPREVTSEFISSSPPATAEAATLYFAKNDWATAVDFENELFDTYENAVDYEADLGRADSDLQTLSNQLIVSELPSGGVAVFWG